MMAPWRFPGPGEMTLILPQPSHPLSINEANRMHWAARAKRVKPWRDSAILLARSGAAAYAREVGQVWPVQPINVQVRLQFRSNARRDPHNFVGTTVKAIVDGLVRGGLIPDDTAEWATVLDPVLETQRDQLKPLTAHIEITPRSNP